jgi:hypothetical protein
VLENSKEKSRKIRRSMYVPKTLNLAPLKLAVSIYPEFQAKCVELERV